MGLLMILVFSAVFLWALTAVVWPVPVVYAQDPEIITITVTSNLETYFYDPGLDPTGGTVYFNSLAGEGAGQVLTVIVTCSGTVASFEGAPAFDDTPPPDTSAPWEITYTVEMGAETQSSIVFTVTNALSQTDTAVITFTQDITDPTITSPTITEGSAYLHANGLTVYYGDEMGAASQAFTVQGNAQDSGVGLHYVSYSAALNQGYSEDFTHLESWSRDYTAKQSNTTSGVITATIYDRLGNFATQTFTYTRDNISPDISYGSPPIVEDSDYLYAPYPDGTTVYYSHQMGGTAQSFTVQGNAADNGGGAGLWRATFSSPDLDDPGPDNDPAEWSGTYNVDSSDSGTGIITVKVEDNVSNTSELTFNYVEDTTAPTVELTDVTNPGYDPNGDELDTDGSNWYDPDNLSAGWYFTSTVTDPLSGPALANASWDHSNDAYDQLTYDPGLDGDGVFNSVSDDGDGMVTVTLTLTDHVGNAASDTVLFSIDNTEPTITSPYIDDYGSPRLHVDELTIYCGDMTTTPQSFDVRGDANDNADGVGLHYAAFSSALGGKPDNDNSPDHWAGTYTANSDDTYPGMIIVTVYDRLGNAANETFYYCQDTTPPVVDVTCPAVTSVPSWTVSWNSSRDPPPNASGLKHFDVQYRVEGSGDWQEWHTNTLLTQDTFGPTSPIPVQDDTTYCFRVRAEDNVSNESSYTNGDDCTTYSSGIKKVFLPIIMAPDPNWGFETGDFTNWQHGSQLAQSVSTAMPHCGNYSALLGSPSYPCTNVPIGSAWLSRDIIVPSSGSPILSFQYRIYTQDYNSSEPWQYDYFAVNINTSEVFTDSNTIHPADQDNCTTYDLDWKQGVVSLNAYKGQSIVITFYNHNRPDKFYNTYTYVDCVSVQ